MFKEFTISYKEKNWFIRNDFITLSAPTLNELDSALKKFIRKQGIVKQGETYKVFMAFDNSTIPQWMRQYSRHYFNRILEIEG